LCGGCILQLREKNQISAIVDGGKIVFFPFFNPTINQSYQACIVDAQQASDAFIFCMVIVP